MKTSRSTSLILMVLVSFAAGACAGIGFPNGGNGTVVSPPNPGGGAVGGGQGGGGVGVKPGGDPADSMKPSFETPVPGQVNPQPVNVWKAVPSVVGRHVTVSLAWWSGPAPCSVLDAVLIVRDGTTIAITPREGASPAAGGQVACPAIAMLHGTVVDLGELGSGSWTIKVPGDLAPIPFAVN